MNDGVCGGLMHIDGNVVEALRAAEPIAAAKNIGPR